jgi:hypothetical protein
MLEALYERLFLSWLDPRWVDGEVHVDVSGRRFMLAERPTGISMRTLSTTHPVIFDDPKDALAAMGLDARVSVKTNARGEVVFATLATVAKE